MNNKIKRRLMNEFDKYSLDKSILDNYEFDVINKNIVYKKNNKINDYIRINNEKGYRLKRNNEGSFRLQSININDKTSDGIFFENQVGGSNQNIPSKNDFNKWFSYVNSKEFLDNIKNTNIPINI